MKEGVYAELEAEKFLKRFVPVAKHVFTNSLIEGHSAARIIGFPLVLKIISKKALHKSDVKGVRLIKNVIDFDYEYKDLLKIGKKLSMDGILVQEYVSGENVILGLKKDKVFGHVLAFGIGGIYTELLKDVAFRACPITSKDAQEMIDELKLKQMLYGYRGRKKVNIPVLKELMIKVSKIPLKYPEIKEMDINPLVINHKKGIVVDARMVI
ncbi:MAG: acetate--CoA ligase family protein [Nanoarchaeota archaeon]|nr:acetate--CoA ligase family protein [Nanoarchaeota archaeon]